MVGDDVNEQDNAEQGSADKSELIEGYSLAELNAARQDWSDFGGAARKRGPRQPRGTAGSARPVNNRESSWLAASPEVSASPQAAADAQAAALAALARVPAVPAQSNAAPVAATPVDPDGPAAAGHRSTPPQEPVANGQAVPDDDGYSQRHPLTAAIPIPDLEERAWHRRIRGLEHQLLGAERTLTYREMAKRMGVSAHAARKLWRALGFPNLDDDVKAFTEADATALTTMVELVREGHLNEETAISLTRSVGQMTDRMVVWQIEALVEDQISNEGYDDAEARTRVVETLPRLVQPLEQLMGYAWRRQLSAALQRLTVRAESGLAAVSRGESEVDAEAALPLARAVGFADLVSYTSLSRTMNERTLAQMVQRFESTCADIISMGGGRLVKTIGDEVLFNAETPEAGAEIALALAEAINDDEMLPQARVALVWGRVLSRMGDIYGPTVNLAARLTALADPGTVLLDSVTASVLEDEPDYLLVPQPPRLVRGFGEIEPSLLLRAGGSGIVLDRS